MPVMYFTYVLTFAQKKSIHIIDKQGEVLNKWAIQRLPSLYSRGGVIIKKFLKLSSQFLVASVFKAHIVIATTTTCTIQKYKCMSM